MNRPKLSVIVPTYRPTSFLREAILSLLDDRMEKEILVIDDHSPEPVNKLIQDLPIKFIRNSENLGPAATQNVGLAHAKGEYVAFMDQDDIAIAGSFLWRTGWLEEHPSEKGVMGALAGILDHRRKASKTFRVVLKRRLVEMPERLSYEFFQKGGWVPLSPLSLCVFRTNFLKQVGTLDERLRRAHDREYLYRILKSSDIPYIDRSVLFYRLHDNNLSVGIKDGKIVPKKRTVAELFLINKSYGIPFPA